MHVPQEEMLLAMTFESIFFEMTCKLSIRRYLPYKAQKRLEASLHGFKWLLRQYEKWC